MSRQPKDYSKGKIYCIRNDINDEIYIGSTCQSLSQRMAQHRRTLKCGKLGGMKLYNLMIDLGEENFYIELIEEYPCENKDQLRKREGEFIREHQTELNTKLAGRKSLEYYYDNKERVMESKKEYRKDNKDKIREYDQKHYWENVEQILERQQKYRENNKEKIKEIMKTHYENNREEIKQKKKKHYEQNKEAILQKKREYRNKNKDEINRRRRERRQELKQLKEN